MANNETPFPRVLKVIQRIRESFPGSVEVYTKGGCAKFGLILLEIFPGGQLLYDCDHVIFELDGRCYDINGFAKKTEHHQPLLDYGLSRAYSILCLEYGGETEPNQ